MRIGVAFVVLLFVGYLAVIGFNRNEDIQSWIPGFLRYDKALHFTAFSILSFGIYFVWKRSRTKNVVLTGTIAYSVSVISECVQALVPYRSFDLHDIIANLLGTTLGLGIAVCIDSIRIVWNSSRNNYTEIMLHSMDP
jgi:glycopeptide antibiotics resistance protein